MMTKGFVDFTKLGEVNSQQSNLVPGPACQYNGAFQAVTRQLPVRKARQPVMLRQKIEAGRGIP